MFSLRASRGYQRRYIFIEILLVTCGLIFHLDSKNDVGMTVFACVCSVSNNTLMLVMLVDHFAFGKANVNKSDSSVQISAC